MRRVYYHSSKFLDASLASILLGLLTGVAINIITGDHLEQFSRGVLFYAIACLFLIFLIRRRQKFDSELAMRASIQKPAKEKWEAAIEADNTIARAKYLIPLLVFVISTIVGTVCIVNQNRATNNDIRTELSAMRDSLTTCRAENLIIRQILSDTVNMKRTEKKVVDSLSDKRENPKSGTKK